MNREIGWWKYFYAQTGTLWSLSASLLLGKQVLADLEREFGELPPESINPEDCQMAHVGDLLDRRPGTRPQMNVKQQLITFLYPIADLTGDWEWACVHCETRHSSGLGCIECLEFICRDCLRAEAHKHPDGIATLQEVGYYFEVGRERARQMEEGALRKLREWNRARLLRPFIDPTFTSLPDADHERSETMARERTRQAAARRADNERWAAEEKRRKATRDAEAAAAAERAREKAMLPVKVVRFWAQPVSIPPELRLFLRYTFPE